MGVQVQEAKPQPQRKRAPLVEIPKDAPKLPNFEAHKLECDKLKKEIDDLYDKIKESKAKSAEKQKDTVREQLIKDQQALIEQRKTCTKKIQTYRDDLMKVFELAKVARQQVRDGERACRQATRESGILEVSDKDLDKQIDDLENRLETGAVGTIKGEKKIMQQIKDLKKKRDAAASVTASIESQLSEAEKSRDVANRAAMDAQTIQAAMDLQRAQVKDLLDKIQEKSDEIDKHSNNSEAKKQREERDSWGEKIAVKKEEMRKKRDDFTAAKEKYNEWKKDYDRLCDLERERRRKEREEEQKKRDEERKERDLLLQSIKRMNPYEKEINAAETLIGYLKGKVAFAVKEDKPAEKKPAHFDAAAAAPANFKGKTFAVLKKDEESFDFGKKKKNTAQQKFVEKKPAEQKEKAVARKPIKHSSEKYVAFEELGLKVPQYTDEVKDTIEKLKEMKKEWESHKKTEKEAMAEEQAELIAKRAAEAAAAAAEGEEQVE